VVWREKQKNGALILRIIDSHNYLVDEDHSKFGSEKIVVL
jgi:hypothetical protein